MTTVDDDFLARLRADIRVHLKTVQKSDLAFRRGQDQSHEVRVAMRHVTSELRVFTDLFKKEDARAMIDELSWYSQLLGNVRDVQLLSDTLEPLRSADESDPAWHQIEETVASRRVEAWHTLHAGMDDARYDRFRGQLHRWRSATPFATAVRRQPPDIEWYLDRAQKRLDKRLLAAVQPDVPGEIVHEARKAAKRLRYAAELAEPQVGKHAKKLRKRAARLQTQLGLVQDTSVVVAFLKPFARKGKVDEETRTKVRLLLERLAADTPDLSSLVD